MITVDSLPKDLVRDLAGRDLVVFDGECVLCSGFFKFLVKHDTHQRFSFSIAQSDLGAGLYTALGMSPTDFETNLVIVDNVIYTRLNAFAAAVGALGGAWRICHVLRILPNWIASPLYGGIARNRYRIFGKFDTCMLPSADIQARFLGAVQKKAGA